MPKVRTSTFLSRKLPLMLSQGYKEYDTQRIYMAKKGDFRDNKDVEMPLDGIGGVNIIVKADVHRSGRSSSKHTSFTV